MEFRLVHSSLSANLRSSLAKAMSLDLAVIQAEVSFVDQR